ncbi:MAG TPA: hypothetical protein VFY36_11575 [Solirubrobacteraceae bacterium]|nr:hypothetical protein [Solirubrobacteraceae bacterium]
MRITLGLGVVVCAVALGATAALAHNFTASIAKKEISEAQPGKVKGGSVGPQAFKFGPVHMTCESAGTKGLITQEVSATLKIVARYRGCATSIKVGAEPAVLKTRFVAPVEYSFHANGFAETGTEGEEGSVEIGGGSAEMKITGIKCVISWPAQTVPMTAIAKPEAQYSAALFSNEEVASTHLKAFPTGFQRQLQISMEFKNMEFSFEEGECSEFKHPEAKTGSYTGVLHEELAGGNLGWE